MIILIKMIFDLQFQTTMFLSQNPQQNYTCLKQSSIGHYLIKHVMAKTSQNNLHFTCKNWVKVLFTIKSVGFFATEKMIFPWIITNLPLWRGGVLHRFILLWIHNLLPPWRGGVLHRFILLWIHNLLPRWRGGVLPRLIFLWIHNLWPIGEVYSCISEHWQHYSHLWYFAQHNIFGHLALLIWSLWTFQDSAVKH